MKQRYQINVQGRVQGVGFRPFVAVAASQLNLSGWVRNIRQSVLIEIEGEAVDTETFLQQLQAKAPAVSKIEVNLHLESYLPGDYVSGINQRLSLYKRLSMIDDIKTLEDMENELRDIYGPLPRPARMLLQVIEIKILGRHLGISKLERQGTFVHFVFSDKDSMSRIKIIELGSRHKSRLIVKSPYIVCLILKKESEKLDIFKEIKWVFDEFAGITV